jgi:hypothetical protein
MCIPLADIRAVDVRPSDGRDVPWFTSPENGVALSAPPGDVVVIHHRSGVRLLPVEQPAGFAEVLDARIAEGANRQF